MQAVTGLSALNQEQKKQKLIVFSQVLQNIQQAPPELNKRAYLGEYLRQDALNVPGMIYTMQELAKQQQDAINAQGQLAAQQEAAKALGGAAQSALTAPTQAQ